MFTGIVGGALRAEQVATTPTEREQLAVDLEDAWNSGTQEQRQEAVAQLPPEQQEALGKIVNDASVDAQKATLLALAGFTALAFAVATFIPKRKDHEVEPGPKAALR